MAENDFLPFAAAAGANVLSQAVYAATAALSTGFQAGTASSAAINKTLRQSSIIAAVIADFIVAQSGQPAIDDGTTATLLANFTLALQRAAAQTTPVYLTTAGSGTVTAPSWATRAAVRAWGGGGAGGAGGPSASSGNGGGGGGGAGGYLEGVIGGIVGGANYTWQVGNGGGLVGPVGLGTSLTDTSAVGLIACNPGAPGSAGTSTAVGIGGVGGTASGPPGGNGYTFEGLTVPGYSGSNGNFFGASVPSAGPGGAAFCGSFSFVAGAGGEQGNSYGCGGGGGAVGGYSGGTGGTGALVLTWLP